MKTTWWFSEVPERQWVLLCVVDDGQAQVVRDEGRERMEYASEEDAALALLEADFVPLGRVVPAAPSRDLRPPEWR